MIILAIDPGYNTGLAVVDTKAGKVLWHKTVTGGWKARTKIINEIHSVLMYPEEHDAIHLTLVQSPMAQDKIPSYNYSGKQSPISLAKNIGLSCYIFGFVDGIDCITQSHGIKLIPPQRGKGMKMDASLFYKIHPEVKRCSEHVRDAVNMALGYTEIGG